jgi:hypothetical protein
MSNFKWERMNIWSQACMFELYGIDEIEKGVFICLGLFIDDGCMLLEKMSVEIF